MTPPSGRAGVPIDAAPVKVMNVNHESARMGGFGPKASLVGGPWFEMIGVHRRNPLTLGCHTPINSRFREALQTPEFGSFAWKQAW